MPNFVKIGLLFFGEITSSFTYQRTNQQTGVITAASGGGKYKQVSWYATDAMRISYIIVCRIFLSFYRLRRRLRVNPSLTVREQ